MNTIKTTSKGNVVQVWFDSLHVATIVDNGAANQLEICLWSTELQIITRYDPGLSGMLIEDYNEEYLLIRHPWHDVVIY